MKYKVEILPQTPNALFTQRESGLTHSPFSLELALYTALKNGDEAAMRLAMEAYFAAGFVIGRMSADSLRQMKFWAVSVIAIAIHYAILGGLDETDAYNLSDEYIRHIDGLFTIDDCMEYLSSRAIQLVRAVAGSKKRRTLSPKIKACVHYIHIHLHEKLTVKELARHIPLSENYLSRLFHREMGQSVSSYILEQKLDAALSMLDAGVPYGQAAYNLSFCSQSHFIQCFKKKYGKTPAAYLRENRQSCRTVPLLE